MLNSYSWHKHTRTCIHVHTCTCTCTCMVDRTWLYMIVITYQHLSQSLESARTVISGILYPVRMYFLHVFSFFIHPCIYFVVYDANSLILCSCTSLIFHVIKILPIKKKEKKNTNKNQYILRKHK